MRGMFVMFPDEGHIWIELKYEGHPNYCLYCGKLSQVNRVCKEQPKGVQHEMHLVGQSKEVIFRMEV